MAKKKDITKSDQISDLISQTEAARLRGVTRGAIQDLIRRRRIRTVQVAGRSLVYRSEILNYVKGEPGRPKSIK